MPAADPSCTARRPAGSTGDPQVMNKIGGVVADVFVVEPLRPSGFRGQRAG